MGEAVAAGIVNNETLGYFMARTYLSLPSMPYCEIKLSYGWTECVGIADRACFDLKVGAAARRER